MQASTLISTLPALAAGLIASWLVVKLINWFLVGRRLPPGPPALPLIGSWPWMQFPLKKFLINVKQQYGPLCSFSLNHRQYISLNTFEAIKEAFVTQGAVLSGRPQTLFSERVFGNSGLVMSEGAIWKQHRRFSLHVLRDFGFGRMGSEQSIVLEAQELVGQLAEANGQPQETASCFGRAISNVICQLVFGQRLANEDSDFEAKLDTMNKITQSVPPQPTLKSLLLSPLYLKLDPDRFMKMPQVKTTVQLIQSILDFCQTQISKKEATYNASEEAGDYIEAYLAERHRLKEQAAANDAALFTDKKLQVSISDLFVAGTDTTSNSLRWAVLQLAVEQETQNQLREQIRDAIGQRQPKMSDRSAMPLVESFLHEVQRFYTLVPLGVVHRAQDDVEVFGFKIPKNSHVIANINAVHRDARNFPNPDAFVADRFIGEQGRFEPSERVIPFLIGRRSCLGEGLAKMELFLILVVLLQRFCIKLPQQEASRLDEIRLGTDGTVFAPRKHELIFVSDPL